jgi:hypothetical protein
LENSWILGQNGENYVKVKRVPPQPSSLWGENVGNIYTTWILGLNDILSSNNMSLERNIAYYFQIPQVNVIDA